MDQVPPLADTTLVILAGGLSSRMGADKAALILGGRTLVEGAVARLAPVCSAVFVSVHARRADIPWPQVTDGGPRAGALGGLAAALTAAQTEWIFAVACDMPAFDESAMRALAAFRTPGAGAVVPRVADPDRGGALRPEPLAAFYRTSSAAAAREQLASGVFAIRPFLERIATVWVDPDRPGAPPGAVFANVNTPEDLARYSE